MTTRQLTIQIDQAGLNFLSAAGQQVALVKSATNLPYAVVWQAFFPLQYNTVTWNSPVCVYASTTALQAEAVLQVRATTPAAGGNTYTYSSGLFDAGVSNLPPTEYGIANNDANVTINGVALLTGGLIQGAMVNGASTANPLDAQAIGYQQRAITSVTDRLFVFPASGVKAGSLLEWSWFGFSSNSLTVHVVMSAPLTVDLTSNTQQTIRYNDPTNSFVPA